MESEEMIYVARGCCASKGESDKNSVMFKHSCCKFDANNWLQDITLPTTQEAFTCFEVRFKNDRKDFFRNTDNLDLEEGDFVAVESSPGHDIGIITLKGQMAYMQMRKKKTDPASHELKKIYRKARPADIDKWISILKLEEETKSKARQMALDLKLAMKINDVEYQGDKTKAIFYYTADDRVDFRQLIKIMAERFGIRIEMRQIGARQEASKLGGIGSCGRELCCATWLSDFKSVTTASARSQQLSLNPQKLTGQCSKLKCCLNYEYDCYMDELRKFPSTRVKLQTKKGEAFYQKSDIFSQLMWYTYAQEPGNFMAISVSNVKKIIELNSKGTIPDNIESFAVVEEKQTFEFSVDQVSLEERPKNNHRRKKRKK